MTSALPSAPDWLPICVYLEQSDCCCSPAEVQAQRGLSDLTTRENHIFTAVPKADVDSDIDWRLAVFAAGKYLLAFDGAALRLVELWRRRRRI